jgi:hypothetical protein
VLCREERVGWGCFVGLFFGYSAFRNNLRNTNDWLLFFNCFLLILLMFLVSQIELVQKDIESAQSFAVLRHKLSGAEKEQGKLVVGVVRDFYERWVRYEQDFRFILRMILLSSLFYCVVEISFAFSTDSFGIFES